MSTKLMPKDSLTTGSTYQIRESQYLYFTLYKQRVIKFTVSELSRNQTHDHFHKTVNNKFTIKDTSTKIFALSYIKQFLVKM